MDSGHKGFGVAGEEDGWMDPLPESTKWLSLPATHFNVPLRSWRLHIEERTRAVWNVERIGGIPRVLRWGRHHSKLLPTTMSRKLLGFPHEH